ncbi:MAG: antitoxin [Candidatus Saccharibacteria bacterium]|nr:antitoxin [Moraxellaceae bacterium]
MQTKLTLRLEDQLIAEAKRYSKQHGKSLSQLVTDYFLNLKQRDTDSLGQQSNVSNTKASGLPPITSALKGVLASAVVDEADYYKYLEDKYLGNKSL